MPMLRLFLQFIVTLIYSSSLWATTFVNRSLNEVVQEAAVIVRGIAGTSHSEWDKSHERIFTYTNFNITEVLRGKLQEKSILLRQPGGSRDGMNMFVPGTAGFEQGEEVVVLLADRDSEDNSYDVPGFTTGKYLVERDSNGETVLVNSLGSSAVYDPKKRAGVQSYSAKIAYDVFKRVVAGEDLPESAHKQFRASAQKPPENAFEAHQHDHKVPDKLPVAAMQGSEVKAPPKPAENQILFKIFVGLMLGGFFFVAHQLMKRR